VVLRCVSYLVVFLGISPSTCGGKSLGIKVAGGLYKCSNDVRLAGSQAKARVGPKSLYRTQINVSVSLLRRRRLKRKRKKVHQAMRDEYINNKRIRKAKGCAEQKISPPPLGPEYCTFRGVVY
jgi:hypothetical protein